MGEESYLDRRAELERYFDRTAVRAWEQLTGDAPLSRVRASVRAGRETMRAQLLSWLPTDLSGMRVLDAGSGTGALAVEAARRGADVTAVDISPTLIALAAERTPPDLAGTVRHVSGDMLATGGEPFDRIVAMDSLIHYREHDMVDALAALGARLRDSHSRLSFTFAPKTPLLGALHRVGQLFPRGDRSPALEPIAEARLRERLARHESTRAMRVLRTERVGSGFYKSQAMELAAP